ncbi:hypothetical protein K1719_039013 [Acacia pycnantha]|nr:hypothetical protein K1719_039013 [Acacia pycnantha]
MLCFRHQYAEEDDLRRALGVWIWASIFLLVGLEIDILSQLDDHSNIVKYYDHKEDVRGYICLFMEYIRPGSLDKYISEQGIWS